MSTKTRNQPLPSKEEGLFKQVVKLYESKQFKKGIKTADQSEVDHTYPRAIVNAAKLGRSDLTTSPRRAAEQADLVQILKKFPDHGETLAMKGLIMNNLPDKHDEAHELVRLALKADIKSYVCWHVYGILHRSDRVYDQAAKCYMNALKWDPENLQICRDLGHLQMQLRDVPGLIDTATKMLALKPTPRNHWMLLAIAHHLDKNHTVAVEVIDAYLDTQDNGAAMAVLDRVELGEIEMFKAAILFEAGELNAALSALTARDSHICDRVARLEMKGKIWLRKEAWSDAEAVYRELIDLIPDNYDYHRGLCASLRLPEDPARASSDTIDRLVSVYDALQHDLPAGGAAERIPLDFLAGGAFQDAARARMARFVQRGIPSLFSDVKPLLANAEKGAALWDIATEMLQSAAPTGEDAVWLRLYLAQHAAARGALRDAISHIVSAAQSPAVGPAVIEVYSAKADILWAAGDPVGAASAADVARRLDLKDRYLNSMAAKYLFRSGDLERAKRTALLFARDNDAGANNLFDMQVMWYELESGHAHRAAGDRGMALRMFKAIVSQFADFTEDQYDFHGYCLRKVTLRAYVDMLRMEDGLYSNDTYGEAACAAVDVYLSLHDDPPGLAERQAEEAKLAAMSDAARKRYLERKKKEEARAAKAAAEQLEKDRAAHNAKKNAGKFDDDPRGEKLLRTADPLGEADKLVSVLKEHASGRLRTHRVAYEVAYRQDRPFLALQAVNQALRVDRSSPVAHVLRVRICTWLRSRIEGVSHPVAKDVLREGLAVVTDETGEWTLAGGCTATELNEEYLREQGRHSLPACLAVAQARHAIDPGNASSAAAPLVHCDLTQARPSVHESVEAHAWLRDTLRDADAAASFHAKAQRVHIFSALFDGEERLAHPEEDSLVADLGCMSIDAS